MPLSARIQANLDRYLASFTPDITEQMHDLGAIADGIGDISTDYVTALDEIQELKNELETKVEALMKLDKRADDDQPMTDADRLEGLREILSEFVEELNGALADAPGPDWNSHLQPLEVKRDQIIEIRDTLGDAARVLDEYADRLGRTA